MDHLIEQYGYLAVFVGTLLEGGTLLSMAGFLAHQGYLQFIPWVVLAGFAGSFLDTQVWYSLGKRSGEALLEKRPRWRPRMATLNVWMEKHRTPAIIGVRFIPGFRTVGAVAFGMAEVPLAPFIVLNALGSLLWSLVVGLTGYVCGHLLRTFMGDIKHLEGPVLGGIVLAGLVLWLVSQQRGRNRRQGGKGI